ncbi:type II secretion system F family protein [Bacillus sp. EB106-08-02-XG196]|jgi:type IV pilus assembly protein PilC|uniref:type II secretion system F family protein n=1 Tax=Bacillus sp. EB106-08-02-XG196 TaxID=2737049 RepID=UPI0015C4A456|nr:type II secretion system F family protein [Bacillus sp. EB106-08-02-XG196]NWQ40202.1 type II secretion system F family protein [Bacillus sp. EB106-08-02-XG196]
MARFKYSGRDKRGKKEGTVTASSRREAMAKLKEDGIRVIEMTEVPETLMTMELTIGNPVKLQHFVIYLRQFATLIKAGVTVVEATGILAVQTESKALKKALQAVEQDLREGNPYSESVAKHKKIFNSMFINMVKAGEVAGNMDETLEKLADDFEKQHDTVSKVKSALTYPAVIGILAIGAVIFLLVGVVPTFVTMFEDMGAELPGITKFVLNASGFMQSFWWMILLIVFGFVFAIMYMKKNKKTKYYLDYFLLRMPIFGNMLQKAALARMMRTLSSLFSSSVPILQAMSIVEKVVENEVIARVIRESRNSLEKGRSMTEPMMNHWAFPPLVTQMISIGEGTGALDAMLSKIAEFYEKEVDQGTDRLKSLIEPIMIVFLAGVVGVIVLSIMMPMFSMFDQMS